MSAPANWFHDLPTPTPSLSPAPITWMRPTPRPKPAPPVRHLPPPRPALRLADALVRWGGGLLWMALGGVLGTVLVAAVTGVTS